MRNSRTEKKKEEEEKEGRKWKRVQTITREPVRKHRTWYRREYRGRGDF